METLTEKIIGLEEALKVIEGIKADPDFKIFRIFTGPEEDGPNGENKGYNYYFSISGLFEGSYFALYMYDCKGINFTYNNIIESVTILPYLLRSRLNLLSNINFEIN